MTMKLRAPAVPLITVDPYFSVWSSDCALNVSATEHWTGKENSIIGTVNIDGEKFLFLGYHKDIHKIRQVSLDIDALSTTAVFENDKITFKTKFLTPLLPDDLNLLTRPVSYLEIGYEAKDGKEHDVSISITVSEQLCLDEDIDSPVVTEKLNLNGLACMKMGNSVQKPLNRSGDDVRIDWGYFYLACNSADAVSSDKEISRSTHINITAPLKENQPLMYYFAYDDIESIEYFGKHLRSYWNKDGKSITEAIAEAAKEYDELKIRCKEFSDKLYNDAFKAGGEKYAELLSLAYRQVIAAHKLVLDENGEILFISKECFSNGCAATVDVSYPSIPMFLIYNPELIKGMMRPVYKFARSDAWEFDFAPHDVGQYPLLNGQVYANNQKDILKWQMPVEECGNMLIMETNVALATGNADFAKEHIDLLENWCGYLIKHGADPGHQLCTDDFAGHLAHNCNLSLKAIMGLQGMSMIMKMLGEGEKSAFYRSEAEKMADIWKNTAVNPDGTTKLAFDQPSTYSMKYNMVWDKVWKSELFTQEFMDAEIADNMKHFNEYGMPLDSRADYTKSDWLVWTASMASSDKVFADFIAPLWKAYNESPSRVPMSDWYDTVSGRWVSFRNRTVQGGLFMRMLMNR
ncbi:MAG: DUF4965 domain-containing protein [Clostridia bacterium]|nr:DUF4965 domain-containing protein [Clostridia bacterium]